LYKEESKKGYAGRAASLNGLDQLVRAVCGAIDHGDVGE